MKRLRMMQLAATDYSFQIHLMPLVEACSQAGFEVICCGASGPFVEVLQQRGVSYRVVEFSRDFNIANHLRCLLQLIRIMEEEKIDILHSHMLTAGLLGRIAAKVVRVPISVYTSHGFRFNECMPPATYWFYVALESLGAWLSNHIFVQNPNDRTAALALRMTTPSKIETIGNGIDLKRFNPARITQTSQAAIRQELEIPSCAQVVTIIARSIAEKGLEEFHHLACHLTAERGDVYFICVLPPIPGERHPIANPFADSPCGDRLRVLGYRMDIPEILALTDVFVLPSRLEGLSKVTIEAMAMATPIVATDIRGIRELVLDGETGILVKLDDLKALVGAVSWLLDNPKQRTKMGRKARRIAQRRFDQDKVLKIQLDTLQTLVQQEIGENYQK